MNSVIAHRRFSSYRAGLPTVFLIHWFICGCPLQYHHATYWFAFFFLYHFLRGQPLAIHIKFKRLARNWLSVGGDCNSPSEHFSVEKTKRLWSLMKRRSKLVKKWKFCHRLFEDVDWIFTLRPCFTRITSSWTTHFAYQCNMTSEQNLHSNQ